MCGNYGVTLTPGGPTGMHTCTDFFILLVLNCQAVCFCFLNYFQMTCILVIFPHVICFSSHSDLHKYCPDSIMMCFTGAPSERVLQLVTQMVTSLGTKKHWLWAQWYRSQMTSVRGRTPTVSLSLAHTADPLDLLPPCPTSSSHCSFKPLTTLPCLPIFSPSARTHFKGPLS